MATGSSGWNGANYDNEEYREWSASEWTSWQRGRNAFATVNGSGVRAAAAASEENADANAERGANCGSDQSRTRVPAGDSGDRNSDRPDTSWNRWYNWDNWSWSGYGLFTPTSLP